MKVFDVFSLRETARATMRRDRGVTDLIDMRGCFRLEHWRDGRKLADIIAPNTITKQGKNHILNTQFHGGTAITTWYMGLINNASFSAITADDTYANINQVGNGWGEFASYTDGNNSDNSGTRPAWVENASSGEAITNSTLSIFNVTGTGTVKGIFLAGGPNGQTKSDHTTSGNILWAATLFGGGDQAVVSGDQLRGIYGVSW
jgi:hypothetical protein